MRSSGFSILFTALATAERTGEQWLISADSSITTELYLDAKGNPIDDSTPNDARMFKVTEDGPALVTDPDDRPIPWGEFRRARGGLALACSSGPQEPGTYALLEMRGLIPHGVYTAWVLLFDPPGFDADGEDTLLGFAPLGRPDGSDSWVIANAHGRAVLETLVPPGPVTVALTRPTPQIPSSLFDAYQAHVVVAYHMDGEPHGPVPGAELLVAEQLAWQIGEPVPSRPA